MYFDNLTYTLMIQMKNLVSFFKLEFIRVHGKNYEQVFRLLKVYL